MTLSPAMNRYLLKAYDLQKGLDYGIYFSLWIPGKTQTGRALLSRKLLSPAHENHCTLGWPLRLSDQGFQIAGNLWGKGERP